MIDNLIAAGGDRSSKDAVEHGGKIAYHFLIANPNDAVAELGDVLVTEIVLIDLKIMDVSVNFDDEIT